MRLTQRPFWAALLVSFPVNLFGAQSLTSLLLCVLLGLVNFDYLTGLRRRYSLLLIFLLFLVFSISIIVIFSPNSFSYLDSYVKFLGLLVGVITSLSFASYSIFEKKYFLLYFYSISIPFLLLQLLFPSLIKFFTATATSRPVISSTADGTALIILCFFYILFSMPRKHIIPLIAVACLMVISSLSKMSIIAVLIYFLVSGFVCVAISLPRTLLRLKFSIINVFLTAFFSSILLYVMFSFVYFLELAASSIPYASVLGDQITDLDVFFGSSSFVNRQGDVELAMDLFYFFPGPLFYEPSLHQAEFELGFLKFYAFLGALGCTALIYPLFFVIRALFNRHSLPFLLSSLFLLVVMGGFFSWQSFLIFVVTVTTLPSLQSKLTPLYFDYRRGLDGAEQ